MTSKIYIVDSDALIALMNKNDLHHIKTKAVITKLVKENAKILFPATTITETITTIQVKLANPDLARKITQMVTQTSLIIVPIDEKILKLAASIFNPSGSKKNTMFDATVAATAKLYKSDTILSFDKWYKRLDFSLIDDIEL